MLIRIVKYSSLILLIAVIVISSVLIYNFNSANSQGVTFKFAGWVWSDNYGWLSLNSDNCSLLNPGDCFVANPPVDYSVQIDSSNNISGYAWSENVGWVCFGDSCTNTSIECPGTSRGLTTLNPTTGQISGWAKVCSLGDNGWIKLGRGGNTCIPGDPPTNRPGEACYDCKTVCLAWTGECDNIEDPTNCSNGETCDNADPSTNPDNCKNMACVTEDLQCNTCFSQTNFSGEDIPTDEDPDTTPGQQDFVIGGSGYIYTACQSCELVTVPGASRTTCAACNSGELYGVNRNLSDGRLLGWAWNGDDTGLIGAGWWHFNTEFGSSYIVFPWLQTLYGPIYTPKWVKQKAGVEGRNATYCILAQDINTNVKSQNCEDSVKGLIKDVNVGYLTPNSTSGIYRNALGKIDVYGMTNKVSGERNKYGQVVTDLNIGNFYAQTGVSLDGKVYHFSGNLIIDDSIKFKNTSANVAGNGIIIVAGNLTINNDITYLSDIPIKLNQLASVVWIVKGDVIVGPNVENLAGAFVVLGNGNTSCSKISASDPDYPQYDQIGCGVFFSGGSNKPLTVLGLIIAKAFDFRRNFANVLQGSERIIYDGRLTTNPPKALSGFVAGLPVIRDFSY